MANEKPPLKTPYTSPENDPILCRLLLDGDKAALTSIVQGHQVYVQVVIGRIIEGIGSLEDVEELTQDVFLYVYHNIHQYDPEKGSLRTWLAWIAKHKALSFRRKVSRRNDILGQYLASETVLRESQYTRCLFEKGLEDRERLEIIEEAFSQLGAQKTQLVRWRILEEKIFREIAALQGCSLSTAKSRTYRALEELRSIIERSARDET
jgi:RNA polymerase sigma-70 factor (ECF subfamily)